MMKPSDPVLHRDVYLLCFSAFFADLGYQGVAALFPLYVVFELHAAIYWYGIITAIAFGGGSFFAYLGGLAGDHFDQKSHHCRKRAYSAHGVFRSHG
ncbi:hypothetical protein AB4090_14835 [Acidithiobacillus sp. IBUN Pt1247-S3]|uniref:hypothetical protein n=1 Tax=Acidithiobacillus sp. IBUN Pt1247-S3 TaxID=3166642 RepID=UPI0034E375A1